MLSDGHGESFCNCFVLAIVLDLEVVVLSFIFIFIGDFGSGCFLLRFLFICNNLVHTGSLDFLADIHLHWDFCRSFFYFSTQFVVFLHKL